MDGFAQNCSNSCALAMELLQSCAKPSISYFKFTKDTHILHMGLKRGCHYRVCCGIIGEKGPWYINNSLYSNMAASGYIQKQPQVITVIKITHSWWDCWWCGQWGVCGLTLYMLVYFREIKNMYWGNMKIYLYWGNIKYVFIFLYLLVLSQGIHSHGVDLGHLLLTWINFNPSTDNL